MARKKAVIYARQSSGKEEESESIALQIEMCRELARKHNIDVIGEFHDANTSGRLYPEGAEDVMQLDIAYQKWCKSNSLDKKSRPGLKKALDALPHVDFLIVHEMTRLYRPVQNSFLQGYIDTRLVENRVNVLTVKEGESNPSNFSDSLVTTIKSHVNDNQIKLTSEKSKLALMKLRDEGYLPTGTRMYGIRYIGGRERRVEVIPEQAEVIRFVFRSTLEHKPYNWILREMNRLYGDRVSGKAFYITSFRHIVAQPFYCGYMYDSHGALIEARQMRGQEIITLDEWRRANDILGNKQRPAQHRKSLPHPFSSLLVCGYCGAKMLVGLDGDKEYYHCITALSAGRDECRQARVTLNLVRQSKYYTGLKKAIAPLLALSLYSSLEHQASMQKRRRELDKLNISLANYQKRLDDASASYVEGQMAVDAYNMVHEKANARIKSLKAEIMQIENANSNARATEERVRKFLTNIDMLMEDRLEPHVFEDLLTDSVKQIRCFYDYLEIDTIYGSFTLKRYMDGKFRNFPKFTYEIIPPDGMQKNPRDTQIHVTYIYGENTKKDLIVDLRNMKIFSQN